MADVTDEQGRGGELEAEDAVGVTTAEKEPAPHAENEAAEETAEEASASAEPSPEPSSGASSEARTETETDRGTVISGDVAAAATGSRPSTPMRSVVTPRRARVVIKKLGPWSVLKISLLFYFCVMIVFLLALTILYLIMSALGTLDSGVKLLSEVGLVNPGFQIHGGWLLLRVFAAGVALVVLWAIVNLFAVFLYNLVADVIGGIEVTLAERR